MLIDSTFVNVPRIQKEAYQKFKGVLILHSTLTINFQQQHIHTIGYLPVTGMPDLRDLCTFALNAFV